MAYSGIFSPFGIKTLGDIRRKKIQFTHIAQLTGICLGQYFFMDTRGTTYCASIQGVKAFSR